MSSRDPLRVTLWVAGLILVAIVAALRPYATAVALRATAGPFGTLAAIIAAAALAGRLGAFRILARALVPSRGPAVASAAAVLAFTAALSALVNLDVAVVVAMPVALRAARRQNLPADRLSIAVAITANATSFLLPTAVTVGSLTIWAGRRAPDTTIANSTAEPSAGALPDLIPMAGIAAAIRALLGTGLVLHGTLAGQLAAGSALAAAADNLPAAAAILPASTPGLWAAILATTIGTNLLLTGSVATLISRRIARDAGARLSAWQFTATGLALVPAQLAAATLGLHITGTLR